MSETVFLSEYQAPDFAIVDLKLTFELNAQETWVHAILDLKRQASAAQDAPIVLQGCDLTLHEVRVDGVLLDAADYQVSQTTLTLPTQADRVTLSTRVSISPENNTALEGLYVTSTGLCTQCEAEGFRHITYYLDRPDVMAPFTVRLEADKTTYPVLLANGNPIDSGDLPQGRHYVTYEDPFKKPCYLFALVAGTFDVLSDHFVTSEGRDVSLLLYVEQGKKERAHHAMTSLKKAMAWDEKVYGLAYDLDRYVIVSVPDFNMGAMENKGLNVFNDRYILVDPESATDVDYEQVESVVGHEYFHNWTGNRVTLRDWFQLSLKEGLTVYREQQFAASMGRSVTKRIEDIALMKIQQFAEDASSLAHPVRPQSYQQINNFYSMTIYHKGAELIRMLGTLLGDKGFVAGVKHYLKTFDGQAATVENFLAALGQANQRDLTSFIRWYEQPHTPILHVAASYDRSRHIYTLTLEQERPNNPDDQPLMLPVKVGMMHPEEGTWLPMDKRATKRPFKVLELCDNKQAYSFHEVPVEPVPALLMDFSAPVRLNYPYTPAERWLMVQHADDAYLRWEHMQALYLHHAQQLLGLRRQGKPLLWSTDLAHSVCSLVAKGTCDPHLAALLLSMPSPYQLIQEGSGHVPEDIEAVHQAMEQVMAQCVADLLADRYDLLSHNTPYVYTPQAVGERSLKNRLLAWLVKTKDTRFVQAAVRQYQKSDNMTDAWAAVSCLASLAVPERALLLAAFKERWEGDALVMDKWLGVQARSLLPNTLEHVIALTESSVFSWKNPNKVYALIRAFALGNPLRLHRSDGAGYAFLQEAIVRLDALNPQVASSLVDAFADFKQYAKPYQTAMKQAVDHLAQHTVSSNVQEGIMIIQKAMSAHAAQDA